MVELLLLPNGFNSNFQLYLFQYNNQTDKLIIEIIQ